MHGLLIGVSHILLACCPFSTSQDDSDDGWNDFPDCYICLRFNEMTTGTMSVMVNKDDIFGQLKWRLYNLDASDWATMRFYIRTAKGNELLGSNERVGDKVKDGDIITAVRKMGGGGAGKRRKAKQQSDTAPTSRVEVLGGWLRALALPVLGFEPLLWLKCWQLAALVLEWRFHLLAVVAWAGLG